MLTILCLTNYSVCTSSWLSGFERRLRVCVERNVTVLSFFDSVLCIITINSVLYDTRRRAVEVRTVPGGGLAPVTGSEVQPPRTPRCITVSYYRPTSERLQGQFQRPHPVTYHALGNVCATALPPLRHRCATAGPPLHPCVDG